MGYGSYSNWTTGIRDERVSMGGQSVGGSNGNADELTNWDGTKKKGWSL